MINVADINRRIIDQNTALYSELTTAATQVSDQDLRAVATMLAVGFAAMHERQGDAMLLMLRSAN